MVLKTITGARGVTFSGDTFVVPQTHDMVKTLFDPTIRKSIFEMAIVVLLFSNGLVFFVPDNALQVRVFIGLYVFWRLMYDFGIGYLLRLQSNSHKLVNWARKLDLFNSANGSLAARLIRSEISSQMGPDYDIAAYPLEFNTWLVFRKVVDLILMSDFVTFVGLVVSCSVSNDFQFVNVNQQSLWLVVTRLVVGSILILFNLWVKVNAHNTIKDYAWYWGDFFFRQFNNEELIFDGVFEMVPHPMYSVGYVGYYGFALISKSYTVLTLACFGHFLQMVFLHFIENPHIDKIYGPSPNEVDLIKLIKLRDLQPFDNLKPMIGLYNFHWSRGSDVAIFILVLTFSVVFPVSTAYTSFLYDQFDHSLLFFSNNIFGFKLSPINIFFLLTVFIKLVESVSINLLLFFQSSNKSFTKFYISNNIPIERSLKNWSILYNTFISLTYSSFFGLNFCFYLIGLEKLDLLFTNWFYLRLFLGSILVLTHVWINTSIVDSIGYFGWFYGDFFIPRSSIPHKAHLTKAGVYRYLNNPEQIFGVCGIMGVTLVIPSAFNCILCALWVVNNFIRINCIEKIHMIRLYGEQEVLQDSGVTKTLKKHLIPESIQRRLSNNHEKPLLSSPPRRRTNSMVANATSTIDQIIKEFKKSNTKLTKQNITELSQNLYFENSDYKLGIRNLAHNDSEDNLLKYVEVGTPIEVEWKCPENHSTKDWVGLYKIVQTSYSRYKTLISSNNRWASIDLPSTNGVLRFEGKQLFWEEGIYEFRYHLDGKHDVAYISEPFEIKCPRVDVPSSTEEILNFSKTLKTTIFDKVISLETVNSPINEVVEKSDNILGTYKKLASLISCATNIKISSKIFLYTDNADLSILKLASKLVHLKQVLDELSSEHYDEEKKNQ